MSSVWGESACGCIGEVRKGGPRERFGIAPVKEFGRRRAIGADRSSIPIAAGGPRMVSFATSERGGACLKLKSLAGLLRPQGR